MKLHTFQPKKIARDLAYDFVGTSFVAIGVLCFSVPNHVAPSGANGVATLLNYLFGVPIGLTAFLVNVPLLLLGYKVLGRHFTLVTLRTVAVQSLATDLIWSHMPLYEGNPLLAALFAGVFLGTGTAIVFMNGSTTGGSDIVSKLVLHRYPYISAGQVIMFTNAVVMFSSAAVYRNIEAALYGVVMAFTSSKMMDSLMYGANTGKYAMIITKRPETLSQRIIQQLHRGVTILDGRGAFNGMPAGVLVCVVRKQQFFELKRLIYEVDPAAFIIISEANEIIGNGFKSIEGSTEA